MEALLLKSMILLFSIFKNKRLKNNTMDSYMTEEYFEKWQQNDYHYNFSWIEFSHNTQSWQHWHLTQMHQNILKNEKEVFFSENPYVFYKKDIIFPQTA